MTRRRELVRLAGALVLVVAVAVGCRAMPAPRSHAVDPNAAELDDACVRRGLASCLDAGRRYEQTLGRSGNHGEGDSYLHRRVVVTYYRGCTLSQAEACARLADFVVAHPGTLEPDATRLGPLYEHACGTTRPRQPGPCASAALHARACELGTAASCGALAILRDGGSLGSGGLGAIPPERLHGMACERGWAVSCERVAQLLLVSGAHRSRDPSRAVKLLRAACDADAALACLLLADRYAQGDGVRMDQTRARKLRLAACEADQPEGCHAVAHMERRGLGGAKQPVAAMAHLRSACELGSAGACEHLARATELGQGVAEDKARAFDLMRRALELYETRCAAADTQACADWGRLLRQSGGGPADEARGRELQRAACEKGNADGCIGVMMRGAMFLPGKGRIVGGRALARACRAGDGKACYVLGRIGRRALPLMGATSVETILDRGCALGEAPSCNAAGVSAFPPSARRRSQLSKACRMGDPLGCHHLALALERSGPEQDLEAAEELHRRACGWSYAPACTRLGTVRSAGGARGASPEAAASLFGRACRLGDPRGCHRLGAMKISGARIGQRVDEGRRLLEQACEQGADAACGLLGGLLLRGRHVERDRQMGARMLEAACGRRQARACAELSEALRHGELLPRDEPRAKTLLSRAAPAAIADCSRGLKSCYDGEVSSAGAVWTTFDGHPARMIQGVPPCDAALERVCEDATDVAVARCEHADAGCREAADLLEQMLAVGLAASRTRLRDTLARAMVIDERACKAGAAEACARLAEAYGTGAREDPRQAERFAERACELDRVFCEE